MPMTPHIPADAFLAEINTDFLITYQKIAKRNPRLQLLMQLGVASNKRREFYGYFESPPLPERWDRGKPIPTESGRAVTYEVVNLDWGKAIGVHENDVDDIKLGSLREWVQGLAKRYATLPERCGFQIIAGAADPRLLPSIPNAPDGASLFSATHGDGSARFGVTGGNIVSGAGISSAADVRGAFFDATERLRLFTDTKGEPLHDEALLDSGYLVIYNAEYEQVFREAFRQSVTPHVDAGGGGAAGVTNIVLDTGMQITLWPTQRLTGGSFIVHATDAEPKPLFEQVRAPLRTFESDRGNSDEARNTKMQKFFTDMRGTVGVNLPYGTILVDNS